MLQLVNLYQPVFRRQPKILSTSTLAAIFALAVIFMSALYFNAYSTMQRLQRTSAELALNHTQLQARFNALNSVASLPTGETVDDEINILQDQLKDRNELLNRIDHLFTEANAGFGEVFESLATINLPGLWLTGVELDQNGSIEISGSAIDPSLVPQYLQLITQHSSLQSLIQGSVNLSREDANQSEINFVLSHNAFGDGP